jgi:hypothetical protein
MDLLVLFHVMNEGMVNILGMWFGPTFGCVECVEY